MGTGVTYSSLTSVGTLNQLNVSSTGITTVGFITASSAYVAGVITASTFSTGIATETVGFTTGIISGPSLIYISPHKVGLTSGTVRIVGNLIVEGSTTTETQATIQTSAKTIGIAVSFVDETLLDGAGIGIGSTSIQKTLLWQNDSKSLKSNASLNVGAGKSYQIDDVPVLSSTTLGTGVTISSLTSVGNLKQLVVSSDTSTNAVRITQVGSGNALVVEDEANPDGTAFIVSSNGSVGIGTTNPTSKLQVQGDASISGLTTTNNLYVVGVGTFQSSNLKIVGASTSFQYSIAGGTITANRTLNLPVISATDTVATLGLSQTFSGNITVSSGNVTHSGTTHNVTATSYTTGTVSIGGASQTGGITLGQATVSQTLNLATGASGVGTTKTINFGTAGLTSSFTQINIGPTAGVGTVVINSGTNLLVGTTTATGTSDQKLQVNSSAYVSGNLGIGTTNPTVKLQVQGDAYITGVTTSTDFNSTSDINLKTNIHQIDDSLAKVIQIRGVTFNWKETNRSSAGVIAQEVEKVLPELVNGEETKTVNYNGVIGALVEAVKELKVENDVLRERLDEVYKKVFG